MIEMIFEKAYTQYNAKQKLSALSEYLGNIPGASTKKFVKMLIFGSRDVSIYNITDIQISKSIAEGTATDDPDQKIVQIIYSSKESTAAMTMKSFANCCKKIAESLADVDPNEVSLEAAREGSSRRGHSFRFYYDNNTGFAVLARNVNVAGIEKFLASYEGDLAKAITTSEVRRANREIQQKIAADAAAKKAPRRPAKKAKPVPVEAPDADADADVDAAGTADVTEI